MSWSAPDTYIVGQVLTSTSMNKISGDLAALNPNNLNAAAAIGAYRKTTSKQVVNTTTETDLLNGEITIASNAINASGVLRLTAWGDWINNTGASAFHPRFKIKLGSGATVVFDTGGSLNTSPAAIRWGWRITFELMNLGATSSQWLNFSLDLVASMSTFASSGAAFTTGEGVIFRASDSANPGRILGQAANSSTIDTTATMALVLSVINATASASYDTTLKGALVEIV